MHEVLSPGSKLSRADNARLARFGQEVSDIFSMEQGVAARVAEAGERMTDSKIIKFFEDVVSKTKEGRIPWEPTAQESNFIAAIGGRFSLSISEQVANGAEPPMPDDLYGSQGHYDSRELYASLERYALVLRDMNGRIGTITDVDEGIHPGAMRELYEAARWQAVHGGEKLSEALEVLQSL